MKDYRLSRTQKERKHDRDMEAMRKRSIKDIEEANRKTEMTTQKCIRCWNLGRHQRCNGKHRCEALF